MPKPTLEEFIVSARKALTQFDVLEQHFVLLDTKGASFNFEADAAIDSTDMLDIVFVIDKDLGIKIGLEELWHEEDPMTIQNLYDSIRQDAKSPA